MIDRGRNIFAIAASAAHERAQQMLVLEGADESPLRAAYAQLDPRVRTRYSFEQAMHQPALAICIKLFAEARSRAARKSANAAAICVTRQLADSTDTHPS